MDSAFWQSNSAFSNLAASVYSAYVRDYKGCIVKSGIEITQPDSLSASILEIQQVSCYNSADGALKAVVTGGTLPYNYSWNDALSQADDTASGLIPGNYRVIITDAHACIDSANHTLTQPLPLMLNNADTADISCFGEADGRIAVYFAGGTLPYAYQWNNGQPDTNVIENLAALDIPYALTVVDANGCENDSFAYQVKGPDADILIEEDIASHTDNLCFGDQLGSFTLLTSGGWENYEYSLDLTNWQTASTFNSLAAFSYSVSVRDSKGCLKEVGITITEPQQLQATAAVNLKTITVSASGGTPPYSYSLNGGSPQTSSSFTNLAAGTYYVEADDANNCGPVRIDNLVVASTGVLDSKELITSIYPNPSKGIFNIDYVLTGNATVKIQVYSLTGSMVFDKTIDATDGLNNTVQLDLTGLLKGAYLIKVNGYLLDTKLIIE
jgi:hypothetical protein